MHERLFIRLKPSERDEERERENADMLKWETGVVSSIVADRKNAIREQLWHNWEKS